MERSSGILLPVYALPSSFGIGTLGKAAYEFADFLHAAGQRYWQMLPLVPVGNGDSPYQSFSSYAGNPYLIDLDMLCDDGLLTAEEIGACHWGEEPRRVDYDALRKNRLPLLRYAYQRGRMRNPSAVERFVSENAWVKPYAEYMALKEHFGMIEWQKWPEENVRNTAAPGFSAAIERYRILLREEIQFHTYLQFLFYQQWAKLREYVHSLHIRIIGDLPIYVAMDSADVWAEPQFFQLDEKGHPSAVSGVPPDYFSADGQLWGNPLYDWDAMEQDGFGWWIRRIDGARKLYDVIRIDHFRGFDTYWAIPDGAKTAREGRWQKGPGMKLVGVLNNWFPGVSYIAEDLGEASPSVSQLLKDSGWPGMRVLEFAFDTLAPNGYQPHTYTENCVCYTGTHDNAPLRQWLEEAASETVAYAAEYFGIKGSAELSEAMLRGGMAGVSRLFVAQMQDVLELGTGHRTNVPGTPTGNWRWRMLPGEATAEKATFLRRMTALYGRI